MRFGRAISREAELLLCLSRARLDRSTTAHVTQLAAGGIDWQAFLGMVRAHRLTPIVYRHLSAIGRDGDMGPALDALRLQARACRVRSLDLTAELIRLLTLFASHGLPAIPFKGPQLAESIYGDPAMREFEDLDILVRKCDTRAATAILQAAGYVPKLPLNRHQEARYHQVLYERGFVSGDGRAVVELHWQLTPEYCRFLDDESGVWNRLATQRVAGQTLNVLAPEDLVALLCAHGAKHLWSRLEWVCSFAEVVRGPNAIDWDVVMREAGEAAGERMLLLGLCLANELLDVPLVPELGNAIRRDRATTRIARRVATRLLTTPVRAASAVEISLFQLRVRERWRHGISGLVRRAFTPATTEWAAFPLPRVLYPLYYVMRPVRLARKYMTL